MTMKLQDTKIAILATNGFEFSELDRPATALREHGATVTIISPEEGSIRGWTDGDWGNSVDVDLTLSEAMGRADEFDALILPGGVMNPDTLRMNDDAVEFTKSFIKAGKPVSAISFLRLCRLHDVNPFALLDAVAMHRREGGFHKAASGGVSRGTTSVTRCNSSMREARP